MFKTIQVSLFALVMSALPAAAQETESAFRMFLSSPILIQQTDGVEEEEVEEEAPAAEALMFVGAGNYLEKRGVSTETGLFASAPNGTQEGDLLFLWEIVQIFFTDDAPAGWTTIAEAPGRSRLSYRWASADPLQNRVSSGNYSLTNRYTGNITAWRNVDRDDPIGQVLGGSTTSGFSSPALGPLTVEPGAEVVSFVGYLSYSLGVTWPPAERIVTEFMQRAGHFTSAGANSLRMLVASGKSPAGADVLNNPILRARAETQLNGKRAVNVLLSINPEK